MDTMDTLAYLIVSYRNNKIHGYVSQGYGATGGFAWRSFMLATVYRTKEEAMDVLKEPEFSLYGTENMNGGSPGCMIQQSAGINSVNPIGEIDIRIKPVILGESVFSMRGHVFA